jgi:agmatine/peptidylarginine deiminase
MAQDNGARRLPAEWEPQHAVMLSWPHDATDWAGMLDTIEPVYVELVRGISRFEPAWILCRDDAQRRHVSGLLSGVAVSGNRIRLLVVPFNDTWVRDYGPVGVIQDGAPRLMDFAFNGWGGKFDATLDNRVTRALRDAGAFDDPVETIELVLEGGAFDGDGDGTLLTTASCLLTSTRNPGLDRTGWERELHCRLGAKRVVWLEHGWLAGDDTDGHVDMLARFTAPDTIAYTSCTDAHDEHHAALEQLLAQLKTLRMPDGRPYSLVPLPIPPAKHDTGGRRLPASYANFLILNGAVLAPVYGDTADEIALNRLRGCFPGREIVPINALPLIRQGGSVHCATMQIY